MVYIILGLILVLVMLRTIARSRFNGETRR